MKFDLRFSGPVKVWYSFHVARTFEREEVEFESGDYEDVKGKANEMEALSQGSEYQNIFIHLFYSSLKIFHFIFCACFVFVNLWKSES